MRTRTRFLMLLGAFASLTGLLFLGWRSARDTADRAECVNALKVIGLALHNYASSYGYFPSATFPSEKLPAERRLSWLVALWGFYEAGPNLMFDPNSAWDEGANRHLKLRGTDKDTGSGYERPLETFAIASCPTQRRIADSERLNFTNYVGISGVDADSPSLARDHPRAGFFGFDRCTRLADVKDGTSNTMAVAETAWRNGPWIAGGSATMRSVERAQQPYIGPGRPFGGLHQGGAFVLLVDGSVRFVSDRTDARVFEALATIAGGETNSSPAHHEDLKQAAHFPRNR